MNLSSKRLLVLAAVAPLSFTLVGCPVNPATGERQLILISEGQEIEMGRGGAVQVAAQMGLYDNAELQEYVSNIGLEMAAKSEKPNLPWSFQVADDPLVNAFALPGGFIFVTRGILAYFNSEAELAGVLGHEIGHVTARHSAEQLSRASLAQLGLVAGTVFVPEFSPYANMAAQGLGLLFLKFGRDDERQSDELGFRYMQTAGYNPTEMVDVFDMLDRVTQAAGGSGIPSWLSTHPDPGDRRARMEEKLAEAGGAFDGVTGREQYMQMIDGLVFGKNPREGFFRDNLFLHPDLEFKLELPKDWEYHNTKQALFALSPNQDAIIQLSLGQGASVEEAAQAFLGQEGLQSGGTSRSDVNGLPAVWGSFMATASDGTQLGGLVVFIEYNDLIYQVLGYTLLAKLNSYDPSFRQSFRSFDRLTEQAALSVEPARLDVVALDRAMTLEEFASRYPSSVSVETLELINAVERTATVPAGERLKRVVGELPPGN